MSHAGLAHRGFTLLELMVAIAVFAVMSVLAYGGLSAVTNTREHTDRETGRMAELQQAFLILQRDVQQAVERDIRDQYGDRQPAMRGTELGDVRLELSRAGYRNPAAQARAAIVRVGYRLKDETLERLSWSALDRGIEAEPNVSRLVEQVDALDIRYLGADEQWVDDWPPQQGQGAVQVLPLAVEVTLDLKDWGPIKRLFVVPGGTV
ncbi:MAG: hypothetical protein AMJ69_04405 [Gammaproteobacteria bacterium SG8_47]|nr:MAG: hypothetical protein AMJ69_04405 [Gammaproteobacteria bacterium SG8_47]